MSCVPQEYRTARSLGLCCKIPHDGPARFVLRQTNSQSTETTRNEFLDVGLKTTLELLSAVTRAELDDVTRHTLGDTLETIKSLPAVSNIGTLG